MIFFLFSFFTSGINNSLFLFVLFKSVLLKFLNILSSVKTITTPIKIKTTTENSEQSSSYMDSRKYNKYNNSTYNYSNIKKEKERDSLARYSKRNTNIEYSSNIIKTNNLNKSFDAVYNNNYYETKKYNEYNNINYFNRVEKSNSKSKSKSKSKEDHRNISPKFGILRKTQTTNNTNILNTKPGKKTPDDNTEYINSKKINNESNEDSEIINQITDIETDKGDDKKNKEFTFRKKSKINGEISKEKFCRRA